MKDRIVIIDGNSLINRAYYAMQRPMMTKEGVYTQAVYGFINMLNKIIGDYEPEYMAVAWDLKAPTFRHKEYTEYKAGRKKMPPELAMQLPIMKDVLEAMNIKNLSLEGYEADDIIGTLSRIGKEKGLSPLIITGDKDALQLAGEETKVLITKKGISEFELYDKEKMLERYGLTPEQFIDLKGLMGDQSDNIPGIPGVGEKTGIALLTQFGSIEEMLKRTEEIKSPKLRTKVEENASLARMSRRLAEILLNVPLEVSMDELRFKEPDYDRLIDIYSKLKFNSLLKKLKPGGGSDAKEASQDTEKEKALFVAPFQKNELLDSQNDLSKDSIKKGQKIYIKVFSDNNHISNPIIFGISILFESEDGWKYKYYPEEETKDLFQLLENQKPLLYGHGLSSDEYALLSNGFHDFETGFDTEVAAYLLDPSKSGYSLKALAMEYSHTDIKEEKEFLLEAGQLDLLGNSNHAFSSYGLDFLEAVYLVEQTQIDQLQEFNLVDVLNNAELPLVKVLASMECQGFKTDPKELANFGSALKEEIQNLTLKIYNLTGEEFNINSTQQLGDILFEKLGLPHGKKTKKGYSTGAEVLEKIRDKHGVIEYILRYRTLTKLNSTYVEGLIPLIGNQGRIRAHFRQTVTATGRISCTEPNLQNIPIRNEYGRLLRKAFVPGDDEHILVGADYSQIELRVLAHLSEDQSLIDAFNNGDDIHRATASRVFDIPYDQVTSLDRSKAKAVNFGVIYGMSGFGLSEELNITRKDADNYIKEYFDKHKKVKAYMDLQIQSCKERGYTETILGRRRYIPEIKSSNYMVRSLGERLAMNSPIQGSAADIIKLAMIAVAKELEERNLSSKLILQVHDELIIDTLISEKDVVEELLLRNMRKAIELKVELVSELNTGNNWYELK